MPPDRPDPFLNTSIYLSIYLSTYLSIYLSIYPGVDTRVPAPLLQRGASRPLPQPDAQHCGRQQRQTKHSRQMESKVSFSDTVYDF